MKYILNKDGTTTKMTDYDYYCQKFGEDVVEEWLDGVTMEDLMDCMDAFSSISFNGFGKWNIHREKHLNILEMILQETPEHLYPSSTYGIRPNQVCTDAIGYLTGRKYGNLEIATFLIQEKIKELKKWLIRDYCFSHRELKLLSFFKDRKGVFIDTLDDYYDDVDRFDIENWFNNKSANKLYVVCGKQERWDVKGENAIGYYDKLFNSLLEAIDETMDGYGQFYLKIYENSYGRLFVDITHHDGHNELEIRELTEKGEKAYNNADLYDDDIIKKLVHKQGYTRNVNFRKRYY